MYTATSGTPREVATYSFEMSSRKTVSASSTEIHKGHLLTAVRLQKTDGQRGDEDAGDEMRLMVEDG